MDKLILLDNRFKDIVKKYGVIKLEEKSNPYEFLVKTIIYQQLHGKAAATIYNRLIYYYSKKHPTIKQLINTDNNQLRNIGLSYRKIEYIKEISIFFNQTQYSVKNFKLMTDHEICKELIKIKGIGQWTVDMFLMFILKRLDIFPLLDLGVKKGFTKIYNMNELPSKNMMIDESKKWKPYRSIAAHYFWKITDDY